jgi:hypothetical protein
MRKIKPRTSFLAFHKGEKQFVQPDTDEQCRQLLQIVRQYREQEDQYYSKLKFNLPAFNEKEKLMQTRKQLDFLLHTFNQ